MKLTPFVLLILSVLFVQSGHSQKNKRENEKQPNIIFILTDDLGYGDLGVLYQNERKKNNDRSKPWAFTPHLDTMANEGAVMLQHYSAAPVCAPSRASLLSGLSQGHANVRNNQFDKALADNHTLANTLQKAGYTTAAIGKWGLQGDKRWSENGASWPARPTNRGFDYFYGYMTHVDGHEHYPKERLYRNHGQVWENDTDVTEALDKCFTGDLWTAKAKQWITNTVKNNEKPFFMFLAYDTPHAVLELPTQAYPKGGGLNGGIQWLGTPGHMINTASGQPDSWMHPDYANATYDHDTNTATAEVPWPNTYKRYATSVRRIDDAVGDILQLLKDLNIDDNTLVVFTSDNGPSQESYLPKPYVPNHPTFFDSYGPFDGIKRDVLEGGLRMPLVVRWPKRIAKNTINNTPSISYDWLPTFMEAAGLPAPANSDGVSLLPSLTNSKGQKDSKIYVEYSVGGKTPNYKAFNENNRNRPRKEMQMIRVDDYVGIRYNIEDVNADFEIYDIKNDTHQANNLAINNAMSELQSTMKARILQMRRTNTSAKRPYDDLTIPSVTVRKIKKGLRWTSYSGIYPWLPNLEVLNPSKKGKTKNLNNFDYTEQEQDLYLFEGYLEVPKDGTYTFSFSASGKAVIKLHDAILVDADYSYQANTTKTETMILQKGLHPIRIYLYNANMTAKPFKLEWETNNITKSSIPQSAFYH
ncbi:sulfatase-like hydrolase/transferase [Snuella lapsa]|uniref:Arylsulfatase n=1 Tax=Snuella lapsa TaxID=870481 RepID=A0ABP6YD14_9FLAO